MAAARKTPIPAAPSGATPAASPKPKKARKGASRKRRMVKKETKRIQKRAARAGKAITKSEAKSIARKSVGRKTFLSFGPNTNLVVDGLAVVIGTATAIKLNQLAIVGPGGIKPAPMALVIEIFGGWMLRKYGYKRLAKIIALHAAGLAGGMIATSMLAPGTPAVAAT